jgi:hypothetical protein
MSTDNPFYGYPKGTKEAVERALASNKPMKNNNWEIEFDERFVLHKSDCSAKEGGSCDCEVYISEITVNEELEKELKSFIRELLSKDRQELLEEIIEKLPKESQAFEGKSCELYLDHKISWCGDCFACENCGKIFILLQEIKTIINKLKVVDK